MGIKLGKSQRGQLHKEIQTFPYISREIFSAFSLVGRAQMVVTVMQ